MPLPKILIVDDNENNRTLLCDALGGEPYTFLEAADGQEALKIADEQMPDLILLDIMMPGIDGAIVLQKLKEQERTRLIPVIMVTALNQDSQIATCLDDGAIDHTAKPFSGLVVRARVRAALRSINLAVVAEQGAGKSGKLLGFLGAKGGAGNTTVAVNVALALAAPQRSVAVVEFRTSMGTLAQQLGVASALNVLPLLDYRRAGEINVRTLSKCLTPHSSGLQLLLAPPTFDDRHEIAPQQAEVILKTLARIADYVIVDFPFLPSKATRAALHCCNFTGLTIELEATSLASAQVTLKGLESWGLGGNLVGAVLINQMVTDSSITVGHARSHLSCNIVGVVPPASDLCRAALKAGQPLVLSHPDSAAAVAFTELATRLMADQVSSLTF